MTRTTRSAWLLAAACWLVAGPVRLLATCSHQHEAAPEHRHDAPPLPPGGPCFCGEMTATAHASLPPALPLVAVVAAGGRAESTDVPFASPPALIPGLSPPPSPPPPEVVA